MISSHSSTGFKGKATALAVLFLLLVSTLVAPATADYSESGISLHTVAHDKMHGAASVSGGHGLSPSPYSQSFSVPDGNVRFARLYVGVWGGTPENQGTLDTSINGASLGSRSLGGSSDSDGMTYASGFGVHWSAYDVTGSVHPGSNSATATTGGDIDGRVYGIVLAVAVENQADPEIEYWFAEGCDNLNAAESKDYASVDFGSGPTPASVTDADLYVTYIASMSGDGDQLQLNGQTIATDAASGSSGSYFDMHQYAVKNLLGDSNSVSFNRGGANRLHPVFAGLVTTGGATPTETPTPTETTPNETPTVTTTETTLTTETTVPTSSTTTAEPTTQVPTTGPTETNTTVPTSTNTTAVPTGTTVTVTATSPTETTTSTTTTVTATTTTQTTTVTPTTTQTVTTATTGVTTSATTVPVTHTATPSATTTKNPEPTVSVPVVNTLFPVNAQTSAPVQAATSSSQVQSPTAAAGTVTVGATVVSTSAAPTAAATQQSQTIATQATAKATTAAAAQTTAPSTGSTNPTSSTGSSSSSSNGAVSTGDSSSGSSSDDYTGVGGGVGTTATTVRTTATATQTQSSAITPTPTPGNTSTPVVTTTTPPFLDTGNQNEYSPLTVPGSSSSKSSSGEKNSQKNILSTIQSTFDRLMSSDLSLLLLIGAVILFILLAFAGLIILVLFLLLVVIAYLYLQQRNRLQKKD